MLWLNVLHVKSFLFSCLSIWYELIQDMTTESVYSPSSQVVERCVQVTLRLIIALVYLVKNINIDKLFDPSIHSYIMCHCFPVCSYHILWWKMITNVWFPIICRAKISLCCGSTMSYVWSLWIESLALFETPRHSQPWSFDDSKWYIV